MKKIEIAKRNALDYYGLQSSFSDPGEYLSSFEKLPNGMEELCNIIHGLIIHRDNTEDLYGFKPSLTECEEVNTRYVKDILKKILRKNDSPFILKRDPRKRFFGSCRDFALMLCSILRFKKVPARLRCGFSAYFEPGLYWDHWVCEYWNKNKWTLVDPEVGEKERQGYGVSSTLNIVDLPRDQFLTAGQAWNIFRTGKENPNLFGAHNIEIYGAWFIRANVLRDLAALNKIELLPWDYTEFFHKFFKDINELTKDEIRLIDQVANLTSLADNNQFSDIRSIYTSNPQLQVGSIVKSYSTEKPKRVKLRN